MNIYSHFQTGRLDRTNDSWSQDTQNPRRIRATTSYSIVLVSSGKGLRKESRKMTLLPTWELRHQKLYGCVVDNLEIANARHLVILGFQQKV